MTSDSPRILHGGSTHCALKYAVMKNKPITAEDVYAMFPNKFRSISRTKESLTMLEKYKLVKSVSTGWCITQNGVNYLKSTAKTYKGDLK